MAETNIRNQIINNVLSQMNEPRTNEIKMPDPDTIKKCKELVNSFLETDNNVKRLKVALKDQNNKKKYYEKEILQIMSRYGLEELKDDVKQVKLRFKQSVVNEPLTMKMIRERLEKVQNIQNKSKDEIENEIFKQDHQLQKMSLKRCKNKSNRLQ